MKTLLFSLLSVTPLLAALPTVGPDYQTPDTSSPAAYRDSPTEAAASAVIAPDWWQSFQDPVLTERIRRALTANQDLRAALARVQQARAVAGQARADYLPDLALGAGVTRERASQATALGLPGTTATTYSVPLSLSWELDLFGRVRRLNESARADLAASGATFDAVQLALTAEVASTHFTLRTLDREQDVVTRSIQLRREAQRLVQARFERGGAGELDAVQASTELAATEADAAALAVRRAEVETALAVLLGEAAPAFTASASPVESYAVVPGVPAGLPSDLLLRRPDIAAAERSLAAANARIGVAKAAFFPSISLTGAAGSASAEIDGLFKADSRFWSIGPSLYLPIFQGGRNRANLALSRARFEESLADYRQNVLIAFREVQDALTASRLLADQANAQGRAVASARRGVELSQKRYDAGFVSYIEVVDTQRTALELERADARLTGQRWLTHVALIKALGGGWQAVAAESFPTGTFSHVQR